MNNPTSLDKQAEKIADAVWAKHGFQCLVPADQNSVTEIVRKELAAFATQVREQSKWVSVAEKPKERHEVLICHNYYAEVAVEPAFYAEGWWQLIRTDSDDMPIVIGVEQVTHWMELPAPPETTEQEE